MKKYVVLYSVSIVLIIAIIVTPVILGLFIPKVRLVMLTDYTYSETVTANGNVIEKSVKNIATEYPFVPKKIFCEVGDTVKTGDVVALVDKQATNNMLTALYNTAPELLPTSITESLSSGSDSLNSILPEKIVSTVSGDITSLNLVCGDLCDAGVVATVSDTDNLCIKVQVNESDISKIKKGQVVDITGAGFDNTYKGKVSKIYPTAQTQISTLSQETVVDVLIDINNCDNKIKAGFSVTANITVADDRNINILPYEAISQDDSGNEFVYVYKGCKANKQIIKTGVAVGNGLEVTKGIDEKDFVVYKVDELPDKVEYVNVTVNGIEDN